MSDPTISVPGSTDLAQLERLLDAAPDGFVVVAGDGRLVRANAAALRMLGLTRDTALGRNAWGLLSPGLAAALKPGYDRVARGRTVPGSVEYVEPLGRWIEIRAFPFEGGVAAFFTDVTGRETEQQRRWFIAKLEAVLRPLGDPERIMEMAASAVGEHLRVTRAGYAEVDEADNTLRIRVQYREGVSAMPDRFPLHEFGADLRALARSGRTIVIGDVAHSAAASAGLDVLGRMDAESLLCVPLVKDDRLAAMFGVLDARPRDWSAADIALMETVAERTWSAVEAVRGRIERERLAQAVELERTRLRELYQDVSQANLAKSEFLATISHELRTPLTAVVGYTEILETGIGGPLTDRQREHLGRIRLSAWHLLQLIEQILTFARVEAGREEVALEVTELCTLVRESVALVSPTAGTKRLHVSLDVPDRPLTVETDPGKVRQILLNLLSNAIKFTERGEIHVRLRLERRLVVLRVSDTGPGIPAEQQQHVFEAFRQVGRSGPGGAGLGLTITRRLAQLMGGDIELESAPGRGSTFTVKLPIRAP